MLFSHKPRPTQLQLMEKLTQSIKDAKNLVVEMPKGTGCTSAAMSVILTWLVEARKLAVQNKTRLPRVVCVVRNSQAIPPFVAAINKLPFKMGVSLFGASRDQLCINPALSDCNRKQKTARCHSLLECGGCNFYTSYRKNYSRVKEVYAPRNLDIEEWKKEGNDEGFCPYYANRAIADESPLVVATFEQFMSVDAYRLAKIAGSGVVYVEDADLLGAEVASGQFDRLEIDSSWFDSLLAEIAKIEKSARPNLKLPGLLQELKHTLHELRARLLQSGSPDQTNPYTTLASVFGKPSNHELFGDLIPHLLEILETSQDEAPASAKNHTAVKKHYPTLESFVFALSASLSSDSVDNKLTVTHNGCVSQKVRYHISDVYNKCQSVILTSEYLPQAKAEFCSMLGILRQEDTQSSGVLVLPHSISPLEQQFCLALVSDVAQQQPHLVEELVQELSGVAAGQALSPGASKKILDLGTWLGRMLQVVPAGVVTVFSSSVLLRYCHDVWRKAGILSQLDNTKKLCLTLQSCQPDHSDDPIDGILPELHGQESSQLQSRTAQLKSDTISRSQALKKYLDHYRTPGAHLVISSADLKYLEQALPGDEAVRAVILLGSESQTQLSSPEFNTRASFLSRLVGKTVSHSHDYGILIAVGAEFQQATADQFLPAWVSKLVANRNKYELSPDTVLEKTKRFFDDVTRKTNQLKFDGDLKKGTGHPPANAWALCQGLADNLKKLNSVAPTTDSVLARRFIPLDPVRKQVYERLKSDAQAQQLNPTVAAQADAEMFEKETTRVKLNDNTVTPAISQHQVEPTSQEQPVYRTVSLSSLLGSASASGNLVDDSSSSITYIPNVDSLRSPANTIAWSAIISAIASSSANLHLSCVICYERDKQFSVSKCGHVCCQECWEIRLRELLECPVCKDKVRPKTLVRIQSK